MIHPASLWLVGAGNMGGAMLRGWLGGELPAECVTVIDPGKPALPEGVRLLDAIPEADAPDWLVLGVKPQLFDQVAGDWNARISGAPKVLLSMLAGIDAATLGARIPAGAVVRVMPNLAVAIGKGVVALHANEVGPGERAMVDALMAPLGLVEWVENEALLHAVTALAGSGPGYVYRLIELLGEVGAELGLPRAQAERFALAMVEGAGALAGQSGEPASVMANRVASPNGTTRAGLDQLDADDALLDLLRRTLVAARDRSIELADAAR